MRVGAWTSAGCQRAAPTSLPSVPRLRRASLSSPPAESDLFARLSELRGEDIVGVLAAIREYAPNMPPDAEPMLQRVARWDQVEPVIRRLPSLAEVEKTPIVRGYVALTIAWPGTVYLIAASREGGGFLVAGVHCWPGENAASDRIQLFWVGPFEGSTILLTDSDYQKAAA